MKKILFLILAMLLPIVANADGDIGFAVGGIYYEPLGEYVYTATVKGHTSDNSSSRIFIPASVTHNDVLYAVKAKGTAKLSIESFDIKAGETKTMMIDMQNPENQVTLVQFDLRLPSGLSITTGDDAIDIAGRTTWKKHTLTSNAVDGITRFLLYSSTNAVIEGTSGAIISIKLVANSSFNGGEIKLENQLMTTPSLVESKPTTYIYNIKGSENPPAGEVKPYVVYNNGTLTFYCDNQRSSRQGTTYNLNEGDKAPMWLEHDISITKAVFDASFADARPTTTRSWFYGCSSMTDIMGIGYLNTSDVEDMSQMFRECKKLNSLDVSKFNTSKVTDMAYMFDSCYSLTSLDVSKFNTANVTSMIDMFFGCKKITIIDVGNFKTDKVTNMRLMFAYCQGLTKLDLHNFNTANVTDMSSMFDNCSSLAVLDVSSFNTAKVTSMTQMFLDCSNLISIDVSRFNTSNVTKMANLFSGCSKLTNLNVSNFNTTNVTSMNGMFNGCNNLVNLDVSHFNTEKVTAMTFMFNGCSSLTELDISSFNTVNVTNVSKAFKGCVNLTNLIIGNHFTSNESTNVSSIFYGCYKLNEVTFTGDIPSSINSKFFEGVGTADSPATLNVAEAYKSNYQMKFEGNKFYGGYFTLNGNDDNPVDAPLEMTCKVLNAVDGIVYDSDVTIKMTRKNTSEQEFNQYAGYKVHRQLENGEWFKNWRGSSSKYALQPGQSLWMRETLLDFEDGFYKVEWGYDDENDNWVSMGSTIIEVRGHDRYKAIWFDEDTMKTFCDDDNLDFSNVEGLKVYIATEFNASTSEVKMQQVNDAVAGTGLLLVGETGCYLAERTASASTYSSNMLVGVLGETTYIKSNEDGYTNFIYNGNNKNDEQKFIIASDKGSPVRSNEAYLRVPSQAAGAPQTIAPVFDKPTVSDEPYVVYNDITLTFYCDNQRSSRQGVVYSLNEGENEPKWVLDDNNRNVKMVVFDASFAKARPTTTYSWFLNCDYLTEIKGIENLNTSEVKNMHTMFAFCKRLKSLDVSHFDTKAVQDMGAMFSCCTCLENIDLRSFDTSNVFMLLSMFYNCLSLTELDLSNFNTSKVEYLDYMFNGCSNLTTLYFGSGFISTDNVGCDEAFAGCQSLSKVVFTGDIPASTNSMFFEGVGTADAPARLDVPEQFEANYAAKFNGNMFNGGYFTMKTYTGISVLSADGQTFDVYSLSGAMVKKGATSLNALPKGVYIVNGRKVVVK